MSTEEATDVKLGLDLMVFWMVIAGQDAWDFLDYRRKNLADIIRRHRAELFVTDWAGSGELDL